MAKKKVTWRSWSAMVAKECGLDRKTCELVLRAAAELTGPENDFDCVLLNELGDLDPEWEKFRPAAKGKT